jgi:hypothetical protein
MPVLRGVVIVFSCVSLGAGVSAQAGTAGQDQGRLSGVTQISYGCPGPQGEGEQCEHWSSFAQARFRMTTLKNGDTRIVRSNRFGRFTLALTVGRYRLTPLPQTHTTGGTTLTVTIQAGATVWARVRFQGFPRML